MLLVQSYTQYIPLPIGELDSWLRTPSIYVFDCSAAGMIVDAFEKVSYDVVSTKNFLIFCFMIFQVILLFC